MNSPRFSFYFLGIALAFCAPALGQKVEGEDVGGGWVLQVDTDSMTDATVGRLLKVENGQILAVKCDMAARDSVYIHLIGKDYLGEQLGGRTRRMLIRFDADEPSNIEMATDGTSAMIFKPWDVRTVARKLAVADRVRFRVYGFDDEIHEFEFTVAGSEPALRRLFDVCLSEF